MSERKTPTKAVRAHCISCVGGEIHEVPRCGGEKCLEDGFATNGVCHFLKHRMGTGRVRVKLIRKFCLYCMGGSQPFVADCPTVSCVFHDFRMGKNPARKNIGGNPAWDKSATHGGEKEEG